MKNILFNSLAKKSCLIIFAICVGCFAKNIAQPTLGFNKILSGLSSPVDIKNAGDSTQRIFIAEQKGTVKIYKNNKLLKKSFLNISNIVKYSGGVQGLLSIAFHPAYKINRAFYVYYNNVNGDITLARYFCSKANPDSADPSSGVILFSRPKPGNHNGGTLQFGKDGYLYLSIGDGDNEGDPLNSAQNGQSFFGKMLRLEVLVDKAPYYSIPPDNPFVNNPNVLDETYYLGLRNPWKWSFDRKTGDVWIADVGQDSLEEIDFRRPVDAGANFGWRCYEGTLPYNTDSCKQENNYVFPIFEYQHDASGGECIIGG
jgi:glucose/arabinose dehydrogenase